MTGREQSDGSIFVRPMFFMKRVSTVIRRGALDADSFQGIGFYMNKLSFAIPGDPPGPSAGNMDWFVGAESLTVTDDAVTLHDESEGVVVEFALPIEVSAGGSNRVHAAYFRPYADFCADGVTYRNWDTVPDDYFVHFGVTFDRSSDV